MSLLGILFEKKTRGGEAHSYAGRGMVVKVCGCQQFSDVINNYNKLSLAMIGSKKGLS